jgi:hypothetical protein
MPAARKLAALQGEAENWPGRERPLTTSTSHFIKGNLSRQFLAKSPHGHYCFGGACVVCPLEAAS